MNKTTKDDKKNDINSQKTNKNVNEKRKTTEILVMRLNSPIFSAGSRKIDETLKLNIPTHSA